MKKIVSAIAAICITSCGETTTTSGNTAPSVTLDKEFVVNFVDEKAPLSPIIQSPLHLSPRAS